MNRTLLPKETSSDAMDTGSHEIFFNYYEQQSLSIETQARFRSVHNLITRIIEPNREDRVSRVLDIGCGAGAQSMVWLESGYEYFGIDINEPLIELARRRAGEAGSRARFEVASATELPCQANSMDVCLMPELLEHVSDWEGCMAEAIRVLRPGGIIYINTSNVLCPVQQEFNLPFYSWYPHKIKAYFVRRALTDWPGLVNYAKYPAVNWFSYYRLKGYLASAGFRCLDRFDAIGYVDRNGFAGFVAKVICLVPFLRLLGHVFTPYTSMIAIKK